MASLNRTLLVVCPEGPTLRVFTCVARFTGWSLGRIEAVDLPSGELQPDLQPELIAAAVRTLVLRWSVPPGVEVVLVLPAVVGGALSLSAQVRRRGVDRAWHEMELAGRIPFALKDIEYEAQPVGSGDDRSTQIAWLPHTVAVEFRTAFARLGLVLGEIVFRPQLFAVAERGPGTDSRELVIERWDGSCFFHLLAGGCVLRTSTAETRSPREFADRLQLELLSLEAGGQRVSRVALAGAQGSFNSDFEAALKDAVRGIEVERRPAEISALFLRFWRSGRTGIWMVPDPPLGMVRRLAFAIAACGVLLAAAMAWHAATIKEEIAALEAREARLRPQYQALVAKERRAVIAATLADAVARFSAAPSEPQAALLAVFNALPHSAWVTRFSLEEDKATVAGRGLDSESVIARLQSQPGVGRTVAASGDEAEAANDGAGPRFRVGFQWSPEEPERRDEGDKRRGPR